MTMTWRLTLKTMLIVKIKLKPNTYLFLTLILCLILKAKMRVSLKQPFWIFLEINLMILEVSIKSTYKSIKSIKHFSSSNMPVDSTHAFIHLIASFAAFYIYKYVVNFGSAVLLKFLNEVLAYFGQSFCLHLSINSVNFMTSLIYKVSKVVPECCNFERLSGRECGNVLFFATSRALTIPKKIYIYNSIIKT
ncbi:hypothetical protein F4703DRAFT_1854778, partial [Phycomyces blakesleeanus]